MTDRPRLLIAEDDPHMMVPLREFFCEQGFVVDCVAGAPEAAQMLSRHPYAVFLTDLHFSEHRKAEGLALLQQARSAQPSIRAIMITAFPTPQLEYLARQLGADVVLSKPIGLLALNAAVSAAVAQPRVGSREPR